LTEIGVVEDNLEVSVCNITGKVADEDVVLDGVVDGAGSFSMAACATGESAQSILMV